MANSIDQRRFALRDSWKCAPSADVSTDKAVRGPLVQQRLERRRAQHAAGPGFKLLRGGAQHALSDVAWQRSELLAEQLEQGFSTASSTAFFT